MSKNYSSYGHLVVQSFRCPTLDLSSGHDLGVLGQSPAWVSVLIRESSWDSFSFSPCFPPPPPPHAHSPSISQINKYSKKITLTKEKKNTFWETGKISIHFTDEIYTLKKIKCFLLLREKGCYLLNKTRHCEFWHTIAWTSIPSW